jgi:hypothetical protein
VEQTVSTNDILSNINLNQNGFAVGKVASLTGLDAQIDEFRFTKGVARTITVPSAAYSNPTSPFVDLSQNPKQVLVLGNASVGNYTEPPTAPNITEVSQPQSGSLTISWSPYLTPPAITQYLVEYSTDGGIEWTSVANGVFDNNSVTISNLADGFYIFRIAAANSIGQGLWTTKDIVLPLQTSTVQYLLVAGGGGGGQGIYGAGGGGAGGILHHTNKSLLSGEQYLITVGAGGASSTSGGNTQLSNAGIAYGGGTHFTDGGSGGGGGHSNPGHPGGLSIQTSNDGAVGYGNRGGSHVYCCNYPCGGGGGAGTAGGNGVASNTPGNGGNGLAFTITGQSVTYAGGGGGNNYSSSPVGSGGSGGGGSAVWSGTGIAGTSNTGSGGGAGGGNGSNALGGSGGSGVAIIRSNTTATTTGSPSVLTDGPDTVYVFNGTGTITFPPQGAPTAPNNIVASQNSQGDVLLSWDNLPSSFNVTDYIVQYKNVNDATWITVNDGTSATNSATISGLVDGSYYVRVAAVNATGQGGWRALNITLPILSVNYLVIAGGGAGGSNIGGGGGGGGVLSGVINGVIRGTTYTVTVGGGGATTTGNTASGSGSNTLFDEFIAVGGGGGGSIANGFDPGSAGVSGGSGGGGTGGRYAANNSNLGGSGTSGQGNAGGGGYGDSVPKIAGGGGGGAGADGETAINMSGGGNGGSGAATSIRGSQEYFAGGGGGGEYQFSNTLNSPWENGVGGIGGGGDSGLAANGFYGTAGATNTGGGGGGAGSGNPDGLGRSGGSGVVILRCSTIAVSTTGSPTVTTDDGYTVYTFTGTGSITF